MTIDDIKNLSPEEIKSLLFIKDKNNEALKTLLEIEKQMSLEFAEWISQCNWTFNGLQWCRGMARVNTEELRNDFDEYMKLKSSATSTTIQS